MAKITREERALAETHIEKNKSFEQLIAAANRDKKQELEKKKKARTKIVRTAQESICYRSMLEDGICEIEEGLWSKSVKFADINYQIAKREDQESVFTQYCEFINYFDPSIHVQITVLNRALDRDDFRAKMLIPFENDKNDRYRKEVNSMLSDKVLQGQNSVIREKYLTFTVEAADEEQARLKLSRIEADTIANFKQLSGDKTEIEQLSGHERLAVIYSMFNPGEPFIFDYDDLVVSNLRTKDYITPDSFDFREKNYYQVGNRFASTVFLKNLPADLEDKLISEISDIECNLAINIHFNSVEQELALDLVKGKIAMMEQQKSDVQKKADKNRTDRSFLPPELKYSLVEAEKLLDDLRNKNQRMYKVTVIVNTIADTLDELTDNISTIMGIFRKNNCKGGYLSFQQPEGMNSSLPLGKCFIERERTLTTASTAIFIPFTTQELFQNNGIYYGVNALSNNLVMINRRTLRNSNGWFLGTPGSGKSMAAKGEMLFNLIKKVDGADDVIIIDPEREYTPLMKTFDGEIIHISAQSNQYINPLDITENYADDENGSNDPVSLKSEFIVSLVDLIAGGKGGLGASEKSIIDRAIRLTYVPFFKNKKAAMPTLTDFYKVLKAQPEPQAQKLALDLELYIEGSLSIFSHATNIDSTNHRLVYDIRDLGGELKTLGMLIVLDQIWNRITLNRELGRRTWIYIDEIYLLFANAYCSEFLDKLFRRARKWGACISGITQNVEDLLLSDKARTMLGNSEFILMLNQARADREQLAKILSMSPRQLSYVTNAPAGQGLIFCSGAIVPFVNAFPKDTELYKLMTTNVDDINSYKV